MASIRLGNQQSSITSILETRDSHAASALHRVCFGERCISYVEQMMAASPVFKTEKVIACKNLKMLSMAQGLRLAS
jgi:hypothetical protein